MKQTCVIHGGYFGPPVLDEAAIRADARREVIEEIRAEADASFNDENDELLYWRHREWNTVADWLEGKS